MLTTSLLERFRGPSALEDGPLRRSRKEVVDLKDVESMRPKELSTTIKRFRLGTVGDSSLMPVRLGINCRNNGILERGALKARLVSVLMIRCEALR